MSTGRHSLPKDISNFQHQFEKEYFLIKDENLLLKLDLHETRNKLNSASMELQSLQFDFASKCDQL
jgi:hypothetical protein